MPVKKRKLVSEDEPNIVDELQKERLSCAPSVGEFRFNKGRVRVLSSATVVEDSTDGILYWMSRDQRVQDNWALLYAQKLALKLQCPLWMCFCLVPKFRQAYLRQGMFMLKGLKEVEQECRSLGIPFVILLDEPKDGIPEFVKSKRIGGVVADFCPLRTSVQSVQEVKQALPDNVPFCQVDSHNVVPCWLASPKKEYMARFMRTKIQKLLPSYLTKFPPVIPHPFQSKDKIQPVNWKEATICLQLSKEVKEVKWAVPGTQSGLKVLAEFCQNSLRKYSDSRNDPNVEANSNLSPWIHFGQISAQRCILVVEKYRDEFPNSVNVFIDQILVRKEISDNFCFYNPDYDKFEGAANWAIIDLRKHLQDKREYLYSREQFENSQTHDQLWNAAQTQMIREGKMHGFLRMYWAKKILEWTNTPEEALEIAIYLNDKYELDGRDPNGYVGCMWSICGVHDGIFPPQKIFGKVRSMSYRGCRNKFKVDTFISKYN